MASSKYNINTYKYIITDHLNSSKGCFVIAGISCIIGIVIGIILAFGTRSYFNLLTNNNQTIIKYIAGSASLTELFWSRLFSTMLAIIILFICSLHYYSSFLGYCYLTYQSALLAIISKTIISFYGFSGVINFIFLLLPTNLVLLTLYILLFSIFVRRAKLTYRYKTNFCSSFLSDNFLLKSAVMLVIFIAVQIVFNLLLPLVIRAVYLINY